MKVAKAVTLILIALVVGCTSIQLKDTANHKTSGYVTGKGMGLAINKFTPKLDATLSESWSKMMKANEGAIDVPADQVIEFYNSSLMAISAETKDPYGIIGDLGALLTIYGAEFSATDQLTFINPVPMSVLRYFEYGYRSGKNIALRERKQ